eukprot:snap_masked-scaffold_16-processed-gene-4.15-mRNA-1 protein AED:1.00 eAED:1.00 QI:0/0/0/0/1/1/2/0/59
MASHLTVVHVLQPRINECGKELIFDAPRLLPFGSIASKIKKFEVIISNLKPERTKFIWF